MKDFVFFALLFFFVFLGLKLFLWAVKSVLLIAVVAATVYVLYRTQVIRRLRS